MKRFACASFAVLLAACNNLPSELRREIKDASQRLEQTERHFQSTRDDIRDAFAHSPDLFDSTPVTAEWKARLVAAKAKLDAAESDRRQLEEIDRAGRKEDVRRARQILSDEDRLRKSALEEADSIQAQTNRWLDFQRNLPHYLVKMGEAHDSIDRADLTSVTTAVEKAARDWPGKRADLESRLNRLKALPAEADRAWQSTEADRKAAGDGKATGAQVAELIQADDVIETSARLPDLADDLVARTAQLYNAWDKILDDLDRERDTWREKIKTVRTHFAEAGDRAPQTSTSERWVDVSPEDYHAVENDLGMAIAHKDAGLYDSEAQTTAQPAGFAYIAPPSVGSNRYGYWTHTEQGSFWTFLPQYLIMRELFWGHDRYRPIVVNEYNSYYNSYRSGQTYYGHDYGTRGAITQQRYATSRYVQSGGFKNSSFASHASPGTQSAPRATPPPPSASDNSQGKRFGRPSGPGGAPAGKRFGGGASPPAGKRFGGGHRR